jgi:hypothetical protein
VAKESIVLDGVSFKSILDRELITLRGNTLPDQDQSLRTTVLHHCDRLGHYPVHRPAAEINKVPEELKD